MSTTNPHPRDGRYTLPPPRTYGVGPAFGPLAKNMPPVEVVQLAEIVRGGPDDNVR